MLPAASKGGGMCQTFPDVCKIPAPPAPFAPAPFPSIGQVNGSSGTIGKVQISNKDAVVLSSSMSRCSGDEGGTLKGMTSATNMSKVAFKKGSSKVYFGGKAAVVVTMPTAHNGPSANMPIGIHCVPSQTKVLVMP